MAPPSRQTLLEFESQQGILMSTFCPVLLVNVLELNLALGGLL